MLRTRSLTTLALLLAGMALTSTSGCVWQSEYAKLEKKYNRTRLALEDEKQAREQASADLEAARKNIEMMQANLNQVQAARDKAIRDLEAELLKARESGSARAAELQLALDTAKQEREVQISTLQEELERAREEARRKAEELARVNRTYEDLMKGLQEEVEQGRVTITNLRGKLTVNLIDKILFDSGSADLNADGKKVLDKVSDVLKDVKGRRISVEGHTDDVPISRAARDRFPSNWELSAARASTVVRYLVERGVPPEKLSAVGYSMFAPVAANDSEDNRRLNRRIEIVLTPEIPVVEPPADEAERKANSL